jgi:hypothetical protein
MYAFTSVSRCASDSRRLLERVGRALRAARSVSRPAGFVDLDGDAWIMQVCLAKQAQEAAARLRPAPSPVERVEVTDRSADDAVAHLQQMQRASAWLAGREAETRAQVLATVVPFAVTHSPGETARKARALVTAVDPAGARARRRKAAEQDHGVFLNPLETGTSTSDAGGRIGNTPATADEVHDLIAEAAASSRAAATTSPVTLRSSSSNSATDTAGSPARQREP